MRRLFIIRKDLHLSPGKLAAMVGHCCEAYWTNLLKAGRERLDGDADGFPADIEMTVSIPRDIWDDYVNGIFTKTICEARNKNRLMKAVEMAKDLGLVEGVDFGTIRDKCLTELTPEDPDGRTLVGVWFRPLPDDVAHTISRKFPLYRDNDRDACGGDGGNRGGGVESKEKGPTVDSASPIAVPS